MCGGGAGGGRRRTDGVDGGIDSDPPRLLRCARALPGVEGSDAARPSAGPPRVALPGAARPSAGGGGGIWRRPRLVRCSASLTSPAKFLMNCSIVISRIFGGIWRSSPSKWFFSFCASQSDFSCISRHFLATAAAGAVRRA